MITRKTLCFTGMDQAEQAALKDLFAQANSAVGGDWQLDNEDDAGVLVIDVDSIYGHMTWLREHNSGRGIVALSSHAEADADYVLLRPVTANGMAELLGNLAAGAPARPPRKANGGKPAAEQSGPDPVAAAEPVAADPAPAASAPEPAMDPPPAATAAAPEPAPRPEPEPAPPPRDPMLIDYLAPGALPGPVALSIDGAPALVIDPQKKEYIGAQPLKPLLPYCSRIIRSEDWEALSPGELEKRRKDGGSQPLLRLRWLCGLAAGNGELLDGYPRNENYKLLKWPQIEREYPKHFRIATVMMKGPQTLDAIAEASGAPISEVIDFVNAYLVSGHAEVDVPPSEEPAEAARSGLLGRLRGR